MFSSRESLPGSRAGRACRVLEPGEPAAAAAGRRRSPLLNPPQLHRERSSRPDCPRTRPAPHPPPPERRSMSPALIAHHLVKTYPGRRRQPRIRALDGLSVEVAAGGVAALLGPNGAGKSTTVKILTTLTRPDSGSAEVAGLDVLARPDAVRRRIGLVSQKPSSDPMATGRENLELAGRIQGLTRSALASARRRAPRPLRPHRRGRPAGQDVVRRDVAQARRGDRAGPPARCAVPRRADHRARPGGARRDVGRDRSALGPRAGRPSC